MLNQRPIKSMNTTTIRFASPTAAPSATTRYSQLKKSVEQRLARELRHVIPPASIRRAINEASDLAERTGFPLLVFPVLAEETLKRVQLGLREDGIADEPVAMAACA
jgi:hypothetical protein